MGKLVTVLRGFSSVMLPAVVTQTINGVNTQVLGTEPFSSGQSTTLTDSEYFGLSLATTRCLGVPQNVADPARPGDSVTDLTLDDLADVNISNEFVYGSVLMFTQHDDQGNPLAPRWRDHPLTLDLPYWTDVDLTTPADGDVLTYVAADGKWENLPASGGGGTAAAVVHVQASPAGTWSIPHTFGRLPVVTVYDSTGAQVEADVSATDSSVSIMFATPIAGEAVLV